LADEQIRELNRELQTKVAEFETLLSVVPVGIAFSTDVECRVVKLNPAAQKIHGTARNPNPQVIGPETGSPPYRVMSESGEIRTENFPLRRAARSGEVLRDAEFEILRADGEAIQILCSAAPLLDGHGKPRGAVAALLDISERKATENALRRANEALEQFAYAAAHDLQEPVRNVVLYTQLLARDYGARLDGEAQQFMQFTTEGARRVQNLIQDLLAYTRATEDDNPEDEVCEAGSVMSEVLANLRSEIERSQGQVEVGELPRVGVRHGHLMQLATNLISNALKYRGPNFPKVQISAIRAGSEWLFTVQDNGMGIPPEHHKRIFRVFKRLHGREIAGTGIGLAICERIVSFYGGRIWVESEAGRGAAFRFTLPAARASDRLSHAG
jgi:PAS domain S-box-containing protein